jgi:hypothetical protein
MKGEINEEFYCLSYKTPELGCPVFNHCLDGDGRCDRMHRKFPTPEQFWEEYSEEYPDDGAVYCFTFDGAGYSWVVGNNEWAKKYKQDFEPVVCACTPFSRPPANWRPE